MVLDIQTALLDPTAKISIDEIVRVSGGGPVAQRMNDEVSRAKITYWCHSSELDGAAVADGVFVIQISGGQQPIVFTGARIIYGDWQYEAEWSSAFRSYIESVRNDQELRSNNSLEESGPPSAAPQL